MSMAKRKYERQDNFEYWLADGSGPFIDVNAALAHLKLDNAPRDSRTS